MKTLIVALTLAFATLSQSAFAMYYACKNNMVIVPCDYNTTEIEVTNMPLTGYEEGSLGFNTQATNASNASKLITISVFTDKRTDGKYPIPTYWFDCYVKSDSPLFEVARTLASSDMPTLSSIQKGDKTYYQGTNTIKIKRVKVAGQPTPNCTSLEYNRGWR